MPSESTEGRTTNNAALLLSMYLVSPSILCSLWSGHQLFLPAPHPFRLLAMTSCFRLGHSPVGLLMKVPWPVPAKH